MKVFLASFLALFLVGGLAFASASKPKSPWDNYYKELGDISKECYAVAGPYVETPEWNQAYNECYYPKRKALGCKWNIPSECNA